MPLTLRGRPVRLSLAWLKPPPSPPDGAMTLYEHLRELRYRLIVAALAIIVAMIVCLVIYDQLFALMLRPYNEGIAALKAHGKNIDARATLQGVGEPLSLQLKVAGICGLIAAAPVWLHQIWAFIVPGLLAKERKWSLIFVSAATPLFLAGVGLAYWVMPKGISVLLGLTPNNINILNMVELSSFLSFMIRVMIVFGLAFEIPLFVVLLNLVGVIKGRHLAKYRTYVIFGVFVFAAVATPTTDPITMLMLAIPMTAMFLISEVIARTVDRRRDRRAPAVLEPDTSVVDRDPALHALSATVAEESPRADTGD